MERIVFRWCDLNRGDEFAAFRGDPVFAMVGDGLADDANSRPPLAQSVSTTIDGSVGWCVLPAAPHTAPGRRSLRSVAGMRVGMDPLDPRGCPSVGPARGPWCSLGAARHAKLTLLLPPPFSSSSGFDPLRIRRLQWGEQRCALEVWGYLCEKKGKQRGKEENREVVINECCWKLSASALVSDELRSFVTRRCVFRFPRIPLSHSFLTIPQSTTTTRAIKRQRHPNAQPRCSSFPSTRIQRLHLHAVHREEAAHAHVAGHRVRVGIDRPSTHPSTSPSLSWVAIGKEEWHIHARGSLSATQ